MSIEITLTPINSTLSRTQITTTLGSVGPQGAPGTDGGGNLVTNFSYGDATPVLLGQIAANKKVLACGIDIDTPFNGTSPALSVGTLADHEQLLAENQNAPATEAMYETTPGVKYGVATNIYLFITPGSGASAGAGSVVLTIEP